MLSWWKPRPYHRLSFLTLRWVTVGFLYRRVYRYMCFRGFSPSASTCSPAYMTELRLCIYSPFSLRCKGIWIDCVSFALDAGVIDGRKGDLLVMSEEQAAGEKLFCPCLLRAWQLFFILSHSLSCYVLLSPCSALLDLAMKLICSKQDYISDFPTYGYRQTCSSILCGVSAPLISWPYLILFVRLEAS